MDNSRITIRLARVAAMIVIISVAAGCATANNASDWLRGRDNAPTDEAVILGAPDADEYLKELYELSSGDANKQANIFDDAASAARLTPGPSSNLRYGMVLGTPGHAGTDLGRAEGILNEVLAESELLTASEISLATIYLNGVQRIISVSTEARNLSESTSRAARDEGLAASQRIAAIEAENARLRAELEDAEQKLEAITSIERSIREQE